VKLHVDRGGAGPDLVLLHGWGLHSGVWAEALPAMARRHRVHAIDLPGHGHSAGATVAEFDDAVDLVADAVPDGAVVAGWSLGGLFAQRLARRQAPEVRALVLVSSTPCFVERADWPFAMKAETLAAFAASLRANPVATIDNFVRLNALHGARNRDAIRAFARRITERGTPPIAALEHGLRWLREVDLRADASSLRLPGIVIHGARDALVPVGAGRWLAAQLPGVNYVELPDAAHLPFFTHTQSFERALESIGG
jgi:pimeloyl-[acyl-carrier protein] methyl ester esterase